MNISIPPNEQRTFKSGILKNGLKYIAIQDETDDSAHISMAIKAGSLDDPPDYMGLAHFLEHMLFLGSEKFKDKGESYFEEVVKSSGGYSNAYTSLYETVYFFNVLNTNLEKPLEIFSRFFIDPLFTESCVEREINAVNSEHLKNQNNDFWFTRQVLYNLSKKDSGINRFTTGTLETLQSNDFKKLRDRMIQFYNDFYCSNNMCLTIQSNKNVDEIIKLIETFFSEIKNKKIGPKTKVIDEKFDMKNKEYQLVPTNDIDTIIYFWNIPTFQTFIGNCATHVIESIIEYNTIHNLKYFLKRQGLANSINVQYLEEGVFILSITVTKNQTSLSEKILKINSIIQYYFNVIIQNTDWVKLYQYIEKQLEINYLYDTKINNLDLVNKISVNLHYYCIDDVYKSSIILNLNQFILSSLCKLLHFKNVNILYSTKSILDQDSFSLFKNDKYYLKKYGELKISFLQQLDKFNTSLQNFNINLENFDVDKLDIKPEIVKGLDTFNKPIEISKQSWYGGVDHFNEPFVSGFIYLSNNGLVSNTKDYMLTLIACSVINQYISEMFCFQLNIGYSISININSMNGLVTLFIGGMNYKYKEFFHKVLADIKTINSEQIIIDNVIDQIREFLINVGNMSPWEYVDYIIGVKKYCYNYSDTDMLEMLDSILRHGYIGLIKKRIKRLVNMIELSCITVIYGNINKSDIPRIDTTKKLDDIPKSIQVEDITITHPNKDEKNVLVMFILPCGEYTPENAALYSILSTLLEQPTYEELRTKGQLGYLVRSSLSYDNFFYNITIKVQSGLAIEKVEDKMNDFIEWFKSFLVALTNDTLIMIKESVKGVLLAQPSSMTDLIHQYIGEISNRTFIFDRYKLIAGEIDKISKDNIITLYNNIISNKKIVKIYSLVAEKP
jgi:insulysin